MADQNRVKSTGTSKQIVRLKGMLKKWQNVTFGSRPITTHDLQGSHGHEDVSGPTKSPIRRVATEIICCDSDDESCYSPEPAPGVPKGYLAVYVGRELRRFIIPTSHLSHPVFKILLEKAEEEFGYDHGSALTIPCEIETFERLLNCMENQTKDHVVGGESPISEHALICF